MSRQRVWVVKHERYDPPTYVRLYGPFSTGDEATEWAEAADFPDFYVALRVCDPAELQEQLDELRRNGQLGPDGRQLPSK